MNLDTYSALLSSTHSVRLVSSCDYYTADGEGMPLLRIENRLGSAVLALQGAHLLSFIPQQQRDLLWVSPLAKFSAGKAIRGGIPLCLPWFGLHPDGLVAHGFARNSVWTLASANECADGSSVVVLKLVDSAETRAIWPHEFEFTLKVNVGSQLALTLTAKNCSATTVPYSFAFHTYFAVDDFKQARVAGLDACLCIDTMESARRFTQQGDVVFESGIDRVYLDVPSEQVIHDGAQQIRVHSNAASCIVWNPGEHAAKMADVGMANQNQFVCVERGNVLDNALTLAPGAEHSATLVLSRA